MTPARTKPHSALSRVAIQLAVIILGQVLACTTLAQDSNPVDCVANDNPETDPCELTAKDTDTVSFAALDWWPLETVPESLHDRQCINCKGRYIDPLEPQSTHTPPGEDDINVRADSSWMKGNEVILIGEANAIQGDRRMRADKVVVDREEEMAILSGNITLREPGVLMLGENAEIYSKTGVATVFNGRFIFHEEHMRGTADILHRDAEGLIHVHNGNLTYCAPGENDWNIVSESMKIDLDEGLATMRNARIEVEEVPVFYSPWLRIPLDNRRRTGLLWPTWGDTSSGGLDASIPLYLNLAPNYDATYAPRYIEDRGLNHQLHLRYLNPRLGSWFAGGAYLKNDSEYKDKMPDDSADRWLGVLRQDGLFNQRWRSKINYSKASDVDYMKDLETTNIDSLRETSLLQLASMDYLGDKWLTTLKAQKYQSLADDISNQYEKLPQFNTQYRSSGLPFTLQPIAQAQYSNFDASRDVVTGQRLYGEAGLSYPMRWQFGYLKPTVKYRQLNYDLSDAVRFPDSSPSAGSALANLDGGLVFERQTSFAGKGMLQTLEPRLYYLYSEREDQAEQPVFDSAELTFNFFQLFRETRFSGHDRLDDANQVSVGLTSRVFDNESGRSLLTASAGQIYYLQNRNVRLSRIAPPQEEQSSKMAGNLVFAPTNTMLLSTSLVWDPHEDRTESGAVQASYKPGNGSVFNIGYTYRRPTGLGIFGQTQTEEASASSYLPLDKNWSIFGAMKYSLENNLSVEDMFGVEYDSCCWTVRLLQLRYYNNESTFINFNDPNLEREKAIQFQFLLKGMGGFGTQLTGVMQDMIRGFEKRDY